MACAHFVLGDRLLDVFLARLKLVEPQSALPRLSFVMVSISVMESDEFEWDDAKADGNLKKHKISFREASRVFQDPLTLVELDLSEDYGEERFLATGLVNELLITVSYTERDERIRIISARKANSRERRAYRHS